MVHTCLYPFVVILGDGLCFGVYDNARVSCSLTKKNGDPRLKQDFDVLKSSQKWDTPFLDRFIVLGHCQIPGLHVWRIHVWVASMTRFSTFSSTKASLNPCKKDTIHARKPHLIHYFLAILNLINQYKSSSIQSSSKKSFQVYPCHAKWIYLRLAFRSGMAEAISKTIASIEATTTTDFREFQSCWFMKLTNNFMLIKISRVYNLE